MCAVAFVVQIGEMNEAMAGLPRASRNRRIFTHCGRATRHRRPPRRARASNPVARKARRLNLRGFIKDIPATDIARGNWQR